MLDTQTRIDGRDTKTVRPIFARSGFCRGYTVRPYSSGRDSSHRHDYARTATRRGKRSTASSASRGSGSCSTQFPPYSTGGARGPDVENRPRRCGTGTPPDAAVHEEFPYTIRIVAEVLESNGSSSMASVCGGALSLMDCGVPIKKPVAGIAMGLIKEGSRVAILSDILGDEDHLGDMDFKVCGTDRGVTAIQMDIKIQGLERAILEQALDQAREGRLHILGKMLETLPAPRPELSQYAPRITTIKVRPDQIRIVIGSGGKT